MGTNSANLQFESEKWKRLIEFIKMENAYCKDRLSEVVRSINYQDIESLERAEYYQSYYIQQETLLSILSADIYSLERMLEKEKFLDGFLLKEVTQHHRRLRQEMEKLTIEFQRGNKLFNDFLEVNF